MLVDRQYLQQHTTAAIHLLESLVKYTDVFSSNILMGFNNKINDENYQTSDTHTV